GGICGEHVVYLPLDDAVHCGWCPGNRRPVVPRRRPAESEEFVSRHLEEEEYNSRPNQRPACHPLSQQLAFHCSSAVPPTLNRRREKSDPPKSKPASG